MHEKRRWPQTRFPLVTWQSLGRLHSGNWTKLTASQQHNRTHLLCKCSLPVHLKYMSGKSIVTPKTIIR